MRILRLFKSVCLHLQSFVDIGSQSIYLVYLSRETENKYLIRLLSSESLQSYFVGVCLNLTLNAVPMKIVFV